MATTQELIDRHLLYREGLAITNLKARRKAKFNLQRAVDYLWNLREFPWTVTITVPTILFAGVRCYLDVAGADDLVALGANTIVTVDGRELAWVPRLEMERLYQVTPVTPGNPAVYTDYEMTGAGVPSSRAIFVYPPLPTASGHTASLSYKFKSPRLHDAGDGAGVDSLNLFPEQWHDPLLYDLMGLYEMRDKANVQIIRIQQDIVNQNLRNFLATERTGASATPVMTPFVPRGLRRVWR